MSEFTQEKITEQVNQANKEYFYHKELCRTRDLFNKICKDNPDMTQKIKKVLTGKGKVIETD